MNRESQRHLQKFGPSGFTMGLKTPVKKALGEQNNFVRNKEINSSTSQEALVMDRPSDLGPVIKNTKQNRQYLNIDGAV